MFNANDGAATVPGIAAGECSTLAVDGKVTLTGGSTVNVGADGYAAAGLSATGAPVGAVALADRSRGPCCDTVKPVAQAAENPPNSRGIPDSRSQNSQIQKAVCWKMAVSDFVPSSFESGSMEDMGKKTKHEKGAGSTPATVQLEKAGVPFKTYEYEHSNDHMDDGYGVEAAKKLGFDEHQVFKTLMADTGSERVVGVVPVSGHMDLKALAAAVGAKKASMADPKVAMRESGYVVGGISPLGQRTHHRTVLDESALQFDEILLSGGKRGFSVGVNPHDLLKVLNAVAAPIGTW